jgi:hypothetical protein
MNIREFGSLFTYIYVITTVNHVLTHDGSPSSFAPQTQRFSAKGFAQRLQKVPKLLLQVDDVQNKISLKKRFLATYGAVLNRDRYDYLMR